MCCDVSTFETAEELEISVTVCSLCACIVYLCEKWFQKSFQEAEMAAFH